MKVTAFEDSVLMEFIREADSYESRWNRVYEVPDALWKEFEEASEKYHTLRRQILEMG